MFVSIWLIVGFLALVLFNRMPAVKDEFLFRLGFSLVIVGFGILPLSIWVLFLPSFALIIVGVVLIVLDAVLS